MHETSAHSRDPTPDSLGLLTHCVAGNPAVHLLLSTVAQHEMRQVTVSENHHNVTMAHCMVRRQA